MAIHFRLSLKAPNEGQDNFFLWSMVILPIIAECSYVVDATYYIYHDAPIHRYQGLVSTILVVFTYLRYCAPIESRKMLMCFYTTLCLLNETGTVCYMYMYNHHGERYYVAIYFGWLLVELCTTLGLLYYRAYRRCQPNFHVESKHLFHFISRLEVILAIFIPFFVQNMSVTLTKHSIAFFLLFDFFSESYVRFQGFWIKSTLYLFVCTVTVCVATEWIYSSEQSGVFEYLSSSFELISAVLCNTLIIFQFSPYHFKPTSISKIAREGLVFHRLNEAESQSNLNFEPIPTNGKSEDTVIDLVALN
ncbi:unnamed protein product [Adineta ricciae]|uniref:Uncharacterized protein n=1 Tax=Adineta ricciae TaxID=249248 RepID=A0A813WHI8_ADIRI|nr:unnamed protein product [Adineta ricciae]